MIGVAMRLTSQKKKSTAETSSRLSVRTETRDAANWFACSQGSKAGLDLGLATLGWFVHRSRVRLALSRR